MKRSVRMAALLAVAMALLVTAGCGGTAKTAGTAQPQPQPQAKVVNIGFTGPLSGGAAFYGEDVLTGMQLAADQIDAAGGFTVAGQKYTLRIVALDDKYLPAESATNARRLVSQYHAPVILCPHSGGIEAMQEFNQQSNFLIAGYTSDPTVFKAHNPLTLIIPPVFTIYMKPFTEREMAAFGKKLALIPSNTAYGLVWGQVLEPVWKAAGGTITINSPFDYNTQTDFSSFISKALATKPDVMLVGGPSQPTAIVIKEARNQGYKGGFIVMDEAKLGQMADVIGVKDLDGAVGIEPFYKYPGANPAVRDKFISDYYAKFGHKYARPTWEQAWNYETIEVLARAMEKAGTVTDPAKIMAAISQVLPLPKNIDLVHISGLTAQGQYNAPSACAFVKNGQYEYFPVPAQ